MPKRYLLAVDIGTSGCKVIAFDFDGGVAGSWTGEYDTYYPHYGYVEQDARDWWHTACRGIRDLVEENNIEPDKIGAIGVDGTGWACIPLDKTGTPLRPAMLWLDRRAQKQADWMKDRVGEDKLIEVSGNPVEPTYITPKILWLRENEPEIYKRTEKFLQSNSYIVYKFTGKYSQDYSQGYGFHFFDIPKGRWDEDIAHELGISLDLMAPLFHSHEIVGTVTAKAAEETGLIAGIPVIAGGLDAACSTLGAGVIHPGQTQEQGGQAGGMSIQVDNPLIHPKLILGYHVVPDQWLLQGGTVGGGGALRWFNEQLGAFEQYEGKRQGISPFEIMDKEAEGIDPGSDGLLFLPYMAGERSPIWDSKAKGVFFGLSYDKTRAHMIRSVMEGVGFSLLHNLDTAKEVGADVEVLNSVGGSANSRIWTQIKAHITGKAIQVPYSDHGTSLGAAILAGVGIGVYGSFEEAVKKTVRIQRTHHPDAKIHKIYGRYYQLYLELYEKLKDSYKDLYELDRQIK
ncbi:MAG: FGGY-family carbohydrate kinase [Clostridiales bacterium]|nr:FGGY-family carbohydrate kinase [Clostridiales bacterium]